MSSILKDILISRNLNNVQRYSLVRTNKSQSVAEHSFGVIVLSHVVFRDLDESIIRSYFKNLESDERVQILNAAELYLLLSSMYHDFGESVTGDIIYPFKNSEHFSNQGERDYVDEVFSKTIFKSHISLLLDFSEEEKAKRISYFKSYISEDLCSILGEDTIANFVNLLDSILKYCDALELLIYTYEEIQSGNKLISHIFDAGMNILSNSKFEFINNNSLHCRILIREILRLVWKT